MAKITQTMKLKVSLGSQPQQRPQACSPQTAPIITPNVHTGKPIITKRKLHASSVVDEGSLRSELATEPIGPPGPAVPPPPVITAAPPPPALSTPPPPPAVASA